MFSRRLPWPFVPNRLTRLLDDLRARGTAPLDLSESNPTRAGLPSRATAIAAALADERAALYEPDPRGLVAARAAIAEDASQRGLMLNPDRLVLTAGTSEAYALLFKLLADPGETVLVPRPGYPLFEYLAGLEGVRVASYPLVENGRWAIDLDALEAALAGATLPRVVVLVNPHNPTGCALRESERVRLDAMCARSGTAIVSDEVFFDYLDPGERSAAARAGDPMTSALASRAEALTFVLGGLSKSCGLPQMKLGWIAVQGPPSTVEEALERLDLAADTYLTVGTPVMRSVRALLEIGSDIRGDIVRRIETNFTALGGRVGARSACRLSRRDGGWYAVLRVPAVTSEENLILALLERDRVLIHPGYFFDFGREAYLVPSLLTATEVFGEGMRRVFAYFGEA